MNNKNNYLTYQIDRFNKSSGAGLQLSPVTIKEDYRKKWHVRHTDFVALTVNGELISNHLYRLGGINFYLDLNKDRYFMLLKHVESFYDDSITMDAELKPHLEGRWVIIDRYGFEKVEFPVYESAYLVKDSVIYHFKNKYYNIETGELYCESSHSFESSEFLFLQNKWDKDESKRGVMKINNNDGSFELFK